MASVHEDGKYQMLSSLISLSLDGRRGNELVSKAGVMNREGEK